MNMQVRRSLSTLLVLTTLGGCGASPGKSSDAVSAAPAQEAPQPAFGRSAAEIQTDADAKSAAAKRSENAKLAAEELKRNYRGPAIYRDPRIAEHAIPQPGDNGITKRDVDLLWKGARLVLDTRPDCIRITNADKFEGHDGAPPYYVTCQGVMNVFFSKRDVERAVIRQSAPQPKR